MIRGFQVVSDKFRKHPNVEIKLPVRSTKYSAGYDFFSPVSVDIPPQAKMIIMSDVKACMQENEVLMLFVRSSIGIKKGLTLANGTGIVDFDYFSNEENDGNIGIVLFNNTNHVVSIEAGERVAQGIFMPFLVAYNGNTDNIRVGGVGSTGK